MNCKYHYASSIKLIPFFILNSIRFIQAEADSTASEKKCQQLETIDNKLTADLAQANEEKEVRPSFMFFVILIL